MIDREQFVAGMALLSGAYGREIDGPVQRLYFSVLNRQLTTEEFQQAVAHVTATETFWPSPAVILSKVPRLQQDKPGLAFAKVNKILSDHGGHRFLPHAVFHAEFDAPTKAAIAAVGGLAAICGTPEERWGTLAKKFAEAYRDSEAPPAIEPADHKLIAAGE